MNFDAFKASQPVSREASTLSKICARYHVQGMHVDVVHDMQKKALQKAGINTFDGISFNLFNFCFKYILCSHNTAKKMLNHKAPKNACEFWTPSRPLSQHHMSCRHLLGSMVSVTCNTCIYRYSTACIHKNHRKLGINMVNNGWLHTTRKNFWQTWCSHNTAKKMSNHKTPETAHDFGHLQSLSAGVTWIVDTHKDWWLVSHATHAYQCSPRHAKEKITEKWE